jgi:thiol-disulfide isomerase/thioredoxin
MPWLWVEKARETSGKTVSRGAGVAMISTHSLLVCSALMMFFLAGCLGPNVHEGQTIDLSADLLSVEGRRVTVDDYREELLFLNFWATWCGPCRQEMPSMAVLHEQLTDRGLAIVAVTDEDPETVRSYLEREPYPFPVLLDPERTLFARFGIHAIPTTLVLDRNNKILFEHTGGNRWDSPQLIEKFQGLLAE